MIRLRYGSIRKCRNAKKMRQEDLAQKANVSSNYISAVERGVPEGTDFAIP